MEKISEIYRTVRNYLRNVYLLIKQKISVLFEYQKKNQTARSETTIQNVRSSGIAAASARKKAGRIRRHGRQKVYRLKGYTTVAKINRKRQSERQQRFLRRLMIGIILILVLILLFYLYNPIKNIDEWYRILGIDKLSDLTQATSTTPAGTGS